MTSTHDINISDSFFSEDKALAWAEFSGDDNPIHFDRDKAKTIGSDELVVHGMLLMAYMKELTSDEVIPGNIEDAVSLKFRMLKAVPQNKSLLFRKKLSNGKRKCSIVSGERDDKYVTLAIDSTCMPALEEKDLIEQNISIPMKKVYNYVKIYGEHELWRILDAVIFSEFIERNLCAVYDAAGMKHMREIDFRKNHNIIVHVSHENIFNHKYFLDSKGFISNPNRLEKVSYSLSRPEIVMTEKGDLGVVEFYIRDGDLLIMCIKMSILMKSV